MGGRWGAELEVDGGWMGAELEVDGRWMGTRRVVTSGESQLTNVPITGSSVKKAREYLERKVLKK